MTSRWRILILTDHYLPGWRAGGPIRSISNMVAALGDRFDFRIVTRDRDHTQTEPYPGVTRGVWTTVGKASVFYASDRQLRLRSLRRVVRDARPDLVFANSLFSIITLRYLLLRWGRRIDRVPLLVAPRGELGGGALSIKSARKSLYLIGGRAVLLFKGVRWQAASPADADAISARLPEAEPLVASNIPSPPIADSLEHPDKVAGSVVFVFVARISRMKNLPFLLEIVSELRGDIRLEVYGPKEQGEWEKVESLISSVPQNIRVSFNGAVAPEEIEGAMARAHFLVLPTLGENFGHSIYESLRVGRPVVISDRTPWHDVGEKGAGWVLPLERRRDWVSALQTCVDMDTATYLRRVEAAHSYSVRWFERTNLGEMQAQVFDEVLAASRPSAE